MQKTNFGIFNSIFSEIERETIALQPSTWYLSFRPISLESEERGGKKSGKLMTQESLVQ